jgi:hypothetical protein
LDWISCKALRSSGTPLTDYQIAVGLSGQQWSYKPATPGRLHK